MKLKIVIESSKKYKINFIKMSNKSNARDYLLHYVKKPLEGVIKKVLNKKPDDPIPLILLKYLRSKSIFKSNLARYIINVNIKSNFTIINNFNNIH